MYRLALVLVILLAVTPAFAQGEQPAAVPAQAQADVALQQLQTDFNALQGQQMTVAVLQSLFTQELSKLRQMEAVFCDRHGLDVEKWRIGLYRFDPKENKFIEAGPTDVAPVKP